ncbi:hypothetical protein GCM10022243_02280 [Saccharothrix violaceirubra]
MITSKSAEVGEESIGVAFRECLLSRHSPGDTYTGRPTATGRGSTHIATAFTGPTSSIRVTVSGKLQARPLARPPRFRAAGDAASEFRPTLKE